MGSVFWLLLSGMAFANFTNQDPTGCNAQLAEQTMMVVRSDHVINENGVNVIRDNEKYSTTDGSALAAGYPHTPLCSDYLETSVVTGGCSSFVYRQRYVVTNFHCLQQGLTLSSLEFYHMGYIDVEKACANLRFLNSADPTAGSTPTANTYTCSRVVSYSMSTATQRETLDSLIGYGVNPPLMPDDTHGNSDFVIMELDRPFVNSGPRLANAPLTAQQPVTVIGYPQGAGRRVSTGEGLEVTHNNETGLYYSNETMVGNSGSPVANANCEVVGLHKQRYDGGVDEEQTPPYIFDEARSCFTRNPDYRNSGVATPIAVINEAFDRAVNPVQDGAPTGVTTEVSE